MGRSNPSKTRFLAAIGLLNQSELKRTKPREALLAVLAHKHGPFSIEEIQANASKDASVLDLVTIYRNMASFEKIGIVRRCDFGDGVARYELQLDEKHHHHHVICTRCRKTESLEVCKLPKFEGLVRSLGYTNITHALEFFGICKVCRQKSA